MPDWEIAAALGAQLGDTVCVDDTLGLSVGAGAGQLMRLAAVAIGVLVLNLTGVLIDVL